MIGVTVCLLWLCCNCLRVIVYMKLLYETVNMHAGNL